MSGQSAGEWPTYDLIVLGDQVILGDRVEPVGIASATAESPHCSTSRTH